LRDFPSAPLSVFVVWEPILVTDSAGVKPAALARVSDRRAAQFWDGRHQVSEHMGGPAAFGPKSGARMLFDMDEYVWDFVAIYAPGFKWTGSSRSPVFAGGPVVQVIGDVRSQLSAALSKQ
jgi:hypothetical protein